MNTIESVYKAFENFIVELSLRRLAGALLLMAVALMVFTALERYSPYFVVGRLERATTLMERLAAFDNSSSKKASDIGDVRAGIARQLHAIVEPPPLIGLFVRGGPRGIAIWKFIAGASRWFLFA